MIRYLYSASMLHVLTCYLLVSSLVANMSRFGTLPPPGRDPLDPSGFGSERGNGSIFFELLPNTEQRCER